MSTATMGRPRKRPVKYGGVTRWRCACCGVPKLPVEFGASKHTSNQLKSWCLECYRKDAAARREADQ